MKNIQTASLRRTPESGQTLVMTVMFMLVIIGFLGLVIDGGFYLHERRDMQGAADAGALAGVRSLLVSDDSAKAVATDYVENKNTDGATATVGVESDANGRYIRVRANRLVDGRFMSLFGMTSPDIGATARARFAQAGAIGRGLPMTFVEGGYAPLVNEAIKTDNNLGPGNRGIVNLPMQGNCNMSSGASDIADLTATSAGGGIDACPVGKDDVINTKTGDNSGQLYKGLYDRICSAGPCNTDSFSDVFELVTTSPDTYRVKKPDSPRIGVIPIIKGPWPNGSKDVTVVSMVVVYLGEDPDLLGSGNHWPCKPWNTECAEVFTTVVPLADISQVTALNEVSEWQQFDPNNTAPVSYKLVD